jgi:hypothetical protein
MKFLSTALLLSVCLAAGGQQNSPTAATAGSLAALVKQQFGSTFSVSSSIQPPLITADFNGDGVEDAVIVADSKEPLPDSYEFKYVVADPYNSYFGFGNPRVTSTFGQSDPSQNHDLLVIFGSGADAWHSSTPKAKFVLINVPFDTVQVGRMLLKKNKPPVFVIKAIESRVMDSAVWWDAKKKKWKWEPGGTLE